MQFALRPTFSTEDRSSLVLDGRTILARDVHGISYLPGYIGLNNLKHTDGVNVVIQALAHIPPLRERFLNRKNISGSSSSVVKEFGELMCKLWSSRNFKSTVSPHELLQAISSSSKKRFCIGKPCDVKLFTAWFLNELHFGMGGTRTPGSSIIHKLFQGWLEVERKISNAPQAEVNDRENGEGGRHFEERTTKQRVPFLFLSLDLPQVPLFKDTHDGKNIIPQVPIRSLLETKLGLCRGEDEEFKSGTWSERFVQGKKIRQRIRLVRLPPFLILHIRRITRNNFFMEKNPSIVNFPITSLDMGPYLCHETINPSGRSGTKRRGDASDGDGLKVHKSRNEPDEDIQVNAICQKAPCGSTVVPLVKGAAASSNPYDSALSLSDLESIGPDACKYDLLSSICYSTTSSGSRGQQGSRGAGGGAQGTSASTNLSKTGRGGKVMKPGSETARKHFAGGAGLEAAGSYRIHLLNGGAVTGNPSLVGNGQWFEIEDLRVREAQPLEITLSETEMLFFKRRHY